jgi:hypothetical protein
VNSALAAFDPLGVVTTTLAVPSVPAGVVQLALVGLITAKDWQATPPTVMPVAAQKFVPAIPMLVPPFTRPCVG